MEVWTIFLSEKQTDTSTHTPSVLFARPVQSTCTQSIKPLGSQHDLKVPLNKVCPGYFPNKQCINLNVLHSVNYKIL